MGNEQHQEVWKHLPRVNPTLEGERVVLRPYQPSDVSFMVESCEDPTIPHVSVSDPRNSMFQVATLVRDYMNRSATLRGWSFVITDKDTGEALGHIGAWLGGIVYGRATVGYWILDRFRGNGYMTEALRITTAWLAQQRGVTRIELFIEPWNAASWRAAEASGYVREALMRRWQVVDGYPRDMYIYTHFPVIGDHFVDQRVTPESGKEQDSADAVGTLKSAYHG